jgi:hypothetical protein
LLRVTEVKVRITEKPKLPELDGVKLDGLVPGVVREMSPSVASWLIAEHYAEPEMRRDVRAQNREDFAGVLPTTETRHPAPRRRSDDW